MLREQALSFDSRASGRSTTFPVGGFLKEGQSTCKTTSQPGYFQHQVAGIPFRPAGCQSFTREGRRADRAPVNHCAEHSLLFEGRGASSCLPCSRVRPTRRGNVSAFRSQGPLSAESSYHRAATGGTLSRPVALLNSRK
ncbi:hypothetical protein SKAU_G00251400 [Synaphobranchus kaupii]|uniref:Uncharacterized protein n=1 Tax=Synaphobranchus kaupii TaxID=118154 RepID=A0A9Q1F2X6_SYNKA|nr:hypothetical protein SKAU_G00251400 [Synaphobranchus kaupii]